MTSYFVYDLNGIRKAGRFPYGALIEAIKLAHEVAGVVYTEDGELRWFDETVDYKFRLAAKISGFVKARKTSNYDEVFCICDQCQEQYRDRE